MECYRRHKFPSLGRASRESGRGAFLGKIEDKCIPRILAPPGGWSVQTRFRVNFTAEGINSNTDGHNRKVIRLSWNEIRVRASKFSNEWRDAESERGNSQTFYDQFFEIFGLNRKRVASFEEPVKRLGNKRGYIDLFWKGVLLVEQKSAGKDLIRAKEQALDYFPGIDENDLPRYILACDFRSFLLIDLESRKEESFVLSDLPAKVELFGFILGMESRSFTDQDPVNIEATELVGEFHDALKETGYTGHDLERLLVRIVFCLFADDTGIFEPRDIFQDFIERTSVDGSDLGALLVQLFQVLNEPEASRQNSLDEDLCKFPYVNGSLFKEQLRLPALNSSMRRILIRACKFDWSKISPGIFGALFQSVMSPEMRRAQGAHYTTERNIMKVIGPLFLDDLRKELNSLLQRKDNLRKRKLEEFQDNLASLKFFDPACGCGNFLIIAYRELRKLELQVIKALGTEGQKTVGLNSLVKVGVSQFYGIEIDEFPARIAEVAMWMMDHIMNVEASLEFGEIFARIPLIDSPHILHGDALEVDWASFLPPEECDYVYGNPPFIGSKMQSPAQRKQVQEIAGLGKRLGSLDFVCAWFIAAASYVQNGKCKIAFVGTNSITQGEQVAQLWPILLGAFKLEISFAHRTFAWGSDARGVAHVHVIIIGLTKFDSQPKVKRLFTYPDISGDPIESNHVRLSPYLVDAANLADPHLVVREEHNPINGSPRLTIGSKPIDGGHYIFTEAEATAFLKLEPDSKRFMHPYVGAEELIHAVQRFTLYLAKTEPHELESMPRVVDRIRLVKQMRLESKSQGTRDLAQFPTRFHVDVVPNVAFLAIPETSSENREYVPIAYLEPPTIPSNSLKVLDDAKFWQFAVLTSLMHMCWLRDIGGRLKSDFRYSIGIVYNTFPWPVLDNLSKAVLDRLGNAVLAARANHRGSCLADLYNPLTMPPDLRKAHNELDRYVDKLYRGQKFVTEQERLEFLLGRYEAMTSPLAHEMRPPKSGRKKSKVD